MAQETKECTGNNFGCVRYTVTFHNNQFSYTNHEENYGTNANVRILIHYQDK